MTSQRNFLFRAEFLSIVFVKSLVARLLTRPTLRDQKRKLHDLKRRLAGQPHTVHYFHRIDDPYCHLMIQVLNRFVEKYDVRLVPHVISRLDPDMVPESEMLAAYSQRDCIALAKANGLAFTPKRIEPDVDLAERLAADLASDTDSKSFLDQAYQTGLQYWSADATAALPADETYDLDVLRSGEALLAGLGHYLSGTLYYGGEWYWGLDRLHFLEARLRDLQLDRGSHFNVLSPPERVSAPVKPRKNSRLSYYFSGRSPYSYIGYFKAKEFARKHGLELEPKPVLPMMMRGLKVPSAKRLYILLDAKREAERQGLEYGNIADPLGTGVERVYAVAAFAREEGKLVQFLDVVLPAIFGEGIDVATDRGLRNVCDRCGMDWEPVKAQLGNRSWQTWVEQNRLEMLKTGCCLIRGLTGRSRFLRSKHNQRIGRVQWDRD